MDSNHGSLARKSRFLSRKANCETERGSQKGCFVCGTDGSNPSPSSEESANFRSLSTLLAKIGAFTAVNLVNAAADVLKNNSRDLLALSSIDAVGPACASQRTGSPRPSPAHRRDGCEHRYYSRARSGRNGDPFFGSVPCRGRRGRVNDIICPFSPSGANLSIAARRISRQSFRPH
jgi:hypothetical protein